jgi:probable HAF family extracellular repeat protein
LRAGLLSAALLAALVIGGSGTVAASVSDGYSVTELGTLPGGIASGAYAINGWGQIVGSSGSSNPGGAVLWDGGTITDLGTLPGYSWSLANGINDNGQIVGMAGMSSGGSRAVLWDQSIQDLGTLGGDFSEADGINNDGKVIGSAWLSGNTGPHAFLWQNGAMADCRSPRAIGHSIATTIRPPAGP